ncbi:MAG: hypothetical protein ABIR26_14275 [Ramlibacter sp.]
MQSAARQDRKPPLPRLLIAGATGVLGTEVVRRLSGQFGATCVLAKEPITPGLRGVSSMLVSLESPLQWPLRHADTGIILFEPPRLFHDRERALWTPQPAQLVEVAQWMRRCGVGTLAVVLPHQQGRLPEALKRGLASLDEHAVAALHFERLLFVRTAQKPGPTPPDQLLPRLANWMLSILKYMVPSSEQPVRAVKVAEFVSAALRIAPAGIHIAAPELVWRAAQGELAATVRRWLLG